MLEPPKGKKTVSFRKKNEVIVGKRSPSEVRGWKWSVGILFWCLDCFWKWAGAKRAIQEVSTHGGGYNGFAWRMSVGVRGSGGKRNSSGKGSAGGLPRGGTWILR